jgi:hypothetical protein
VVGSVAAEVMSRATTPVVIVSRHRTSDAEKGAGVLDPNS